MLIILYPNEYIIWQGEGELEYNFIGYRGKFKSKGTLYITNLRITLENKKGIFLEIARNELYAYRFNKYMFGRELSIDFVRYANKAHGIASIKTREFNRLEEAFKRFLREEYRATKNITDNKILSNVIDYKKWFEGIDLSKWNDKFTPPNHAFDVYVENAKEEYERLKDKPIVSNEFFYKIAREALILRASIPIPELGTYPYTTKYWIGEIEGVLVGMAVWHDNSRFIIGKESLEDHLEELKMPWSTRDDKERELRKELCDALKTLEFDKADKIMEQILDKYRNDGVLFVYTKSPYELVKLYLKELNRVEIKG